MFQWFAVLKSGLQPLLRSFYFNKIPNTKVFGDLTVYTYH